MKKKDFRNLTLIGILQAIALFAISLFPLLSEAADGQKVDLQASKSQEVTLRARFVEVDGELLKALLTTGVGASTNSSQHRILTGDQFKAISERLKKRDHAELLFEGEVTKRSGQLAHFEVETEEQTRALFKKFGVTNGYLGGFRDFSQDIDTNTTPYAMILDVTASVAENDTIQLKIAPYVTEFLEHRDGNVSLQKTRVRKAVLEAAISNGSTLMQGGLDDQWVISRRDGTQEVRPFKDDTDKCVVIFVTVMIGDQVPQPNQSRRE